MTCVRSDSYLGVDLQEDIKLDVQKAWEAPKEHKQWEFTVMLLLFTSIEIKVISRKYVHKCFFFGNIA